MKLLRTIRVRCLWPFLAVLAVIFVLFAANPGKDIYDMVDLKKCVNPKTWTRQITGGENGKDYNTTPLISTVVVSGGLDTNDGPICDRPTPEFPGGSVSEVTSERLTRVREWDKHLPVAYVITPTYTRVTQVADLLRLCYTLMHVPRVHWILIEDSAKKTQPVTDLLKSCRGPTKTHLTAQSLTSITHQRGTRQRNAGISWLRRCFLPANRSGGVYFADDDNTYDINVFESVRWTKTVSVWLVGIVGGALFEGPVCRDGKASAWELRGTSKGLIDMVSVNYEWMD